MARLLAADAGVASVAGSRQRPEDRQKARSSVAHAVPRGADRTDARAVHGMRPLVERLAAEAVRGAPREPAVALSARGERCARLVAEREERAARRGRPAAEARGERRVRDGQQVRAWPQALAFAGAFAPPRPGSQPSSAPRRMLQCGN